VINGVHQVHIALPRAPSAVPAPIDPHEIAVLVVMEFGFAMPRPLLRFADAAREVNVGGVDDEPLGRFFDVNDAVEGMFLFFRFLLVTGEADHLRPVLVNKRTAQCDDASGKVIVDPMTSLAEGFMCISRAGRPMPASMVIDSAALWADGRLVLLLDRLVRVLRRIQLSATPATSAGAGHRPRRAASCPRGSYLFGCAKAPTVIQLPFLYRIES